MYRHLLLLPSLLFAPNLQAAVVVIDTFSGSYLNRDIAHEGGTLNIRVTGDTNDAFLSTTTGNAVASAFHKSALLLADSDSGTTDLRLAFSSAVNGLTITFTDVDADATPTFANPTPNDVLIAAEYVGLARALASGGNAPTTLAGWTSPNLNVVGQLIKANNGGTSAIVRFEFDSPQTFVRINYQNGAGGGGTGGVGITEIRFETVPEPSSFAMLLVFAVALICRRR